MLGASRHPGSSGRLRSALAKTDWFGCCALHRLSWDRLQQVFRVETPIRPGQRTQPLDTQGSLD